LTLLADPLHQMVTVPERLSRGLIPSRKSAQN
jgi:hypothetical protein